MSQSQVDIVPLACLPKYQAKWPTGQIPANESNPTPEVPSQLAHYQNNIDLLSR
jgi:hypothetical protein